MQHTNKKNTGVRLSYSYIGLILFCHFFPATGELDDIVGVSVESEDVKYAGKGHSISIRFGSGYSIAVTETATIADKR